MHLDRSSAPGDTTIVIIIIIVIGSIVQQSREVVLALLRWQLATIVRGMRRWLKIQIQVLLLVVESL